MNKNSPFSKSLYQFYTRIHTNSYINFQLTKQFIIYRIDKFFQSISKKINQALHLSVIILILSNRYLLLQITKIYHTQKKKKKRSSKIQRIQPFSISNNWTLLSWKHVKWSVLKNSYVAHVTISEENRTKRAWYSYNRARSRAARDIERAGIMYEWNKSRGYCLVR